VRLDPPLIQINYLLSCNCLSSSIIVNPLEYKGNYSATSNILIWNWYTGHWWVGWYSCYSEEGTGRLGGAAAPRPLLAVPNVTAHSSTASVPIPYCRYSAVLIMSVKGLTQLTENYATARYGLSALLGPMFIRCFIVRFLLAALSANKDVYTVFRRKKHPLLFSCITFRKSNQYEWKFQTI